MIKGMQVSVDIVSIHAPAGGATKLSDAETVINEVSIHAPAGGATLDFHWSYAGQNVSIHAPAGGATFLSFVRSFIGVSFNPRARRGRDLNSIALLETTERFQSTRPQGARRPWCGGRR